MSVIGPGDMVESIGSSPSGEIVAGRSYLVTGLHTPPTGYICNCHGKSVGGLYLAGVTNTPGHSWCLLNFRPIRRPFLERLMDVPAELEPA